MSSHLVGREPILADIRGAIERALTGRGGLLLLTGEAGIGKTALAAEAAAAARAAGAAVGWATCAAGAPGFWPWTQVFRSLEAPGELERLTTAEARREGTGDRRLALFDELTASLLDIASRRPLLLVLDDLQWADSDSLGLLAFVARRLPGAPVLVVGGYRDTEVGEEAIRQLAEASTQAKTIPLGGLTAADTARLMESILGRTPPADLCASVRDRTAGNPFFVGELTRLLKSHPGATIAGCAGSACARAPSRPLSPVTWPAPTAWPPGPESWAGTWGSRTGAMSCAPRPGRCAEAARLGRDPAAIGPIFVAGFAAGLERPWRTAAAAEALVHELCGRGFDEVVFTEPPPEDEAEFEEAVRSRRRPSPG